MRRISLRCAGSRSLKNGRRIIKGLCIKHKPLKMKKRIHSNVAGVSPNFTRGDVVFVDFGECDGHTLCGRHPGLVLIKVGDTVTLVPISSWKGDLHDTEMVLEVGQGGLEKDSRLKLSQVKTVDARCVLNVMGALDRKTLGNVEERILSLWRGF